MVVLYNMFACVKYVVCCGSIICRLLYIFGWLLVSRNELYHELSVIWLRGVESCMCAIVYTTLLFFLIDCRIIIDASYVAECYITCCCCAITAWMLCELLVTDVCTMNGGSQFMYAARLMTVYAG